MKAKLIVVGGTTSTTEVNLRLPTIIGRGRSVQVTIPHALVSRQHCEISESAEGRLLVRDLDSMNGTYIGDERITEGILEPGALLTVGTVTFRAVYEVGDNEDSQPDDSEDSCLLEPMSSNSSDSRRGEELRSPDFETVPVEGNLSRDARLTQPLSDTVQASETVVTDDEPIDEEATKAMSDCAEASSLESAAKNSD